MAQHPATATRMRHVRPVEHRVEITRSAMVAVLTMSLESFDGLETGGILLGTQETHGILIRQAGAPGPNAVRTPDRFLRDLPFAQRLADDAWATTQTQWIGEWHTHIDRELAPSATDLSSYIAHLRDPDLAFQRLVSMIIGVSSQGIRAATWLIQDQTATLVPLTIEEG